MLARPAGLPIPDDVSEVLPYISQTNCRLCFSCYKNLTGSRGVTLESALVVLYSAKIDSSCSSVPSKEADVGV